MSSELFEDYEVELTTLLNEITKALNTKIPNYTGEQKKQAIHNVNKDLEKANELHREMVMEIRSAPPNFQQKLQAKTVKYQQDITKLRKDLNATSAGTFVADRQALFGNAGYDDHSGNADTRALLLENQERLQKTSDRLHNTRRVAEESEQIGQNIMVDLGTQREQIVRVGQRVQSMDANLGKSKSILTSMGRRIASSKIILFSTIILLIGILGIVIYFKLKH